MSYVPATSDKDLWAMLGGLVAAGLGLLWLDRMKARRREKASMDALGATLATGEPEPDAVQGRDRTEAGQEPEAPR
jgi:hypothetical protein